MKRKKKRPEYTPCFVFTPEMIKIAEKAMKLFEQSLQRVEGQPAKMVFAEETMWRINSKLDTMKMSVGAMCLITFDYNEKVVIATAIQLYALDLLATPFDARRERELQKCGQIERFALDNLAFGKIGITQD